MIIKWLNEELYDKKVPLPEGLYTSLVKLKTLHKNIAFLKD